MPQRPDSEDFTEIFCNDIPLLDVRAPVEFEQGAFPAATNIPLLNDEQRHEVGKRYKDAGQDAAIKLGWELATPEVLESRQTAWADFATENAEGYLYCFRGGLRSKLSQELMEKSGQKFPRIIGGYKAMRRFLIDSMEENLAALNFINVGGRTGSGKTVLLNQLEHSIDLEGLANHRGSAFGAELGGQPSQIDFENSLAIDLLKHRKQERGKIFIEDEGRLIGRSSLPKSLVSILKSCPLVVVEEGIDSRTELLYQDYVGRELVDYKKLYGDEKGARLFSDNILERVSKIQRRLGDEAFKELNGIAVDAQRELLENNNPEGYRGAVKNLLQNYYDRMYEYQLDQKENEVVFRGSRADVLLWAKSQT